MPNPRNAVRAYLLAIPAIAAKLGTRMRPGYLDPDDYEADGFLASAVIRKLDVTHESHLKGLGGLGRAYLVIDVCSKTSDEAEEIAELIVSSGITAFKGVVSGTGVDLRGVQLVGGPTDAIEASVDGDGEIRAFISTIDFQVDYSEHCDP